MSELDLQHYKNAHPFWHCALRACWCVVWTLLGRTTPRGSLFRPWRTLLVKLFGGRISWSANILPRARIWSPWTLEMGDYSTLSNDVFCYSCGKVVIGRNVTVSEGAWLCPVSHDISSPVMTLQPGVTILEDDVWVAARAFVGHIRVGQGSVIGACAVATKDLPPWSIAIGNPAQIIGQRTIQKPALTC